MVDASDAFKALQSIVLDKHALGDLKYLTKFLTKFSDTGILEIFHALHKKWILKIQHFSQLRMVTRSQLAIMEFNSGSDVPQAKTKGGQGKYNFGLNVGQVNLLKLKRTK